MLPHLDCYLRSWWGEFRLVPLGDGRTRLEGSTWYQLRLGPEPYWQVYSDWLIHTIHHRVLQHIRAEAEAGVEGVGQTPVLTFGPPFSSFPDARQYEHEMAPVPAPFARSGAGALRYTPANTR